MPGINRCVVDHKKTTIVYQGCIRLVRRHRPSLVWGSTLHEYSRENTHLVGVLACSQRCSPAKYKHPKYQKFPNALFLFRIHFSNINSWKQALPLPLFFSNYFYFYFFFANQRFAIRNPLLKNYSEVRYSEPTVHYSEVRYSESKIAIRCPALIHTRTHTWAR